MRFPWSEEIRSMPDVELGWATFFYGPRECEPPAFVIIENGGIDGRNFAYQRPNLLPSIGEFLSQIQSYFPCFMAFRDTVDFPSILK